MKKFFGGFEITRLTEEKMLEQIQTLEAEAAQAKTESVAHDNIGNKELASAALDEWASLEERADIIRNRLTDSVRASAGKQQAT